MNKNGFRSKLHHIIKSYGRVHFTALDTEYVGIFFKEKYEKNQTFH